MQGYSHAVKGHVPHGLLPAGLVILHQSRLDASLPEILGHSLHQRLVTTRVVGQVDAAVALVAHAARLRLGRADEGQTCTKLHAGEVALHVGLHADAVLDEDYQRVFV